MYTSKNLSKWFVIVLLLVSCVVLAKPAFARSTDQTDGVIRYVKAGGNGDCSSWAQACELQTALFIATPGDQIWVAAGTYKPTTSSNRSATFQMKSGVAIYGGFPAEGGDETSRDWQLNKTYLSGDIGLPGNINDNCYHVVTAISVDVTGSLDGFYVLNGNANSGYEPDNEGGGIYLSNAAPTLTNVTFSDNTASYLGGGMYNYDSSPSLTNITFLENTATTSGGGMYNYDSSPSLTNVTFSANTAEYGGGIFNSESSLSLINVTFSANTATSEGGGMHNAGNATLTNVTFAANTATKGGGMYTSFNSGITLTDVTFAANTATKGGGMYTGFYDSVTLTNVTFTANTAVYGGGIYMDYYYGSAMLTNVTFSENIATSDGGGMYNSGDNATLTNVTFSTNTATSAGGGIYNSGDNATLINVTFSENIASYIGGGLYNSGDNATLTDVIFVANTATSDGGGMYNSGGNAMLTNVNFVANTATYAGGGMYNSGGSATLTNVTFSANTAGQGGGMYNNYQSSATLTNVTFSENTGTNYGGGMYNYDSSATLTNVTFSANTAGQGGGLYNWYSSATLTNVTFVANTGTNSGGGMYNSDSSATLTNVTFSANTAEYGGGMYNSGDNATLTDVTFVANTGTNSGGGMYNYDSSATLTNVTFSANTAEYGGGMYNNYYSSATLTNVTFSTNTAESGGGIYGVGSNVTLTNAILWDNSPDQIVGKAYVVTYSDIQGGYPGEGNINSAPLLGPLEDNGGFTLTHALLEGSPAIDAGNLSVCPLIDQRSFFRPVDGNGDGIEGCDMGAYEYGSYLATYTINISTFGNGSVIKEPEKDFYNYGEVVTLTAIADPGWSFGGWGGDASGLENPLTLIMDKNINIEVAFTQNEYTFSISINPQGKGTVTVTPIKPFYHYGDVVTLTATPTPGWSFANWTGDTTGTANPVEVTITGNTSITANFTQDEYTLTVTVDPENSGTVSLNPQQATYHYGDVVELTATPNPLWSFAGWSGDASGTDNPLTITILGNTEIIANFQRFWLYLPLISR